MITTSWELVLNHTSELGEGPVWDMHGKRILWLDIVNGHIHSYYPETSQHTTFSTGQMTGTIVLRKSGGLLAAMENGFYEIDENTGEMTFLTDPESQLPGNRFNDGKCDPQGRFWAGTMSIDESIVNGNLYRYDPNGNIQHFEKNIGCSNGLAWSSDHQTMYYIDSPTRQVYAYDYEAVTGNITNKRVAITIPEGSGYPDGMTIDAEGMLWIALWDGWGISRYNPLDGQLLQHFEFPAARITSCTFGGEQLNDLYVTSAYTRIDPEEREKQPLAGSLFVLKNLPVRGLVADQFGN